MRGHRSILGQSVRAVASSVRVEGFEMRNALVGTIGIAILLASSSALAQPTETPPASASGSAEVTAPLPTPEPTPAPPVIVPAPTHEAAEEPKAAEGTDHEKVVGKFGAMYFGVSQQPIAGGPNNNPIPVSQSRVSMPVIGARYWVNERLGVDVGLGFNFFSSSTTSEANGAPEQTTDGPAVIAVGIHGGVPLAFAHGKHYTFLAIPELNFGYGTQTVAAQNTPTPPPDIHRTGLRLDVGGRIGTEIQFGFIGIPELALQASVGLNFRYERWAASQDAGPTVNNPRSGSYKELSLGTTVQSDPWALFTNNISAIYYFP